MSVAIVNDYEIVVAGVAAALAPFVERVRVVELDSGLPVLQDVDVILYDTFGAIQGDGIDLEDLVHGTDAKVVIFSWNVQPDLIDKALARGARGYISKATPAEQIVEVLEAVHAGRVMRPRTPERVDTVDKGDWPGREHGLTPREAEIIALITQGLSNQEIAAKSYLSINSVKTYIRTSYRKMGVTRRAQAVAWGMQHGFQPDRVRRVGTAPR
jgi:DNA-binding NarL/FixJ family response regulator